MIPPRHSPSHPHAEIRHNLTLYGNNDKRCISLLYTVLLSFTVSISVLADTTLTFPALDTKVRHIALPSHPATPFSFCESFPLD